MIDHDRGCFQMLTLTIVTTEAQEGRRNTSLLYVTGLVTRIVRTRKHGRSTQNKHKLKSLFQERNI